MKIKMLIALGSLQLLFIAPASAEIFKCTNVKGDIYYNDKPCPVTDTEKKMRSEKDVVGGYVPPRVPVVKEKGTKKDKKLVKKEGGFSGKPFELTDKEKSDIKAAANNLSIGPSKERRSTSSTEENTSSPEPTGNYSERERTLEDKKLLLGIRKTVQ